MTNLNLPVMAATGQREVVVNDAVDRLDSALTRSIILSVTDTNAVSLTADQFRRNVLFTLQTGSPAPDGAITLEVPDLSRGQFVVRNITAQNVTVEIDDQSHTPAVLSAGNIGKFICDGANVYLIAQGDGT